MHEYNGFHLCTIIDDKNNFLELMHNVCHALNNWKSVDVYPNRWDNITQDHDTPVGYLDLRDYSLHIDLVRKSVLVYVDVVLFKEMDMRNFGIVPVIETRGLIESKWRISKAILHKVFQDTNLLKWDVD